LTSNVEFASELLILFFLLGERWVSTTSEDGSRLGDTLFMLSFPTSEHVGVDSEVDSGFADPFGLGEFDGCEFVFGCVGFVAFHCCLHCEAVLVVHKILYISWFKERFTCRVLADTGFGTTEFIQGCAKLELHVVVGMACDRKTNEGFRLDQLRKQGGMHFLRGCSVPVYVAWYKLEQKAGAFEWRYVVSNVAANAKTIVGWGKRRWRIEAFFKTMKSRFGLDQFGQRTRLGVLRFLLIAFIAYLLAFWTSLPLEGLEIPDWIRLAAQADLWLVTWVVVFELERKRAMVAEVLEFKKSLIA
jgi:Transposase DDE domain